MNNKQLTVAWIATIIISLMILFTPQKHRRNYSGEPILYDAPQFVTSVIEGKSAIGRVTTPVLQWNLILPESLIILLISGLLIYFLKDKKK